MKQIKLILVGGTIGLFLIGCGQQISKSEAEKIALSHAGLSEEKVTFLKTEKEREDGKTFYEVEFYAKDSREFDYLIDAKTGDILAFDADTEDKTSADDPSVPSRQEEAAVLISEEEAKGIVLQKVAGATEEDIREWKQDRDDGKMEYDGKIIYNNVEYEFEINAETGEIIKWEEEPARN